MTRWSRPEHQRRNKPDALQQSHPDHHGAAAPTTAPSQGCDPGTRARSPSPHRARPDRRAAPQRVWRSPKTQPSQARIRHLHGHRSRPLCRKTGLTQVPYASHTLQRLLGFGAQPEISCHASRIFAYGKGGYVSVMPVRSWPTAVGLATGSPDLLQVRGGCRELGFGLGCFEASAGELAKTVPVLEVSIDRFYGDAAAPVGLDPSLGGEPDAHLLDQLRLSTGHLTVPGHRL